MGRFKVFWIYFIIYICFKDVLCNIHEVTTELGVIQGSIEEVEVNDEFGITSTKKYVQYLGIPYSEPPIGELRFKKPLPKTAWTRPHNGTFYRPMCVQSLSVLSGPMSIIDGDMSEDCLTLDIYSPIGSTSNEGPYPVLIFLFGAAGGSQGFVGDVLCAYRDITVVVINTRTDLLGYFSIGDEAALGNFGLWDEKMAIDWVHQHISNFNGDKNRISLVGSSLGGSNAILQALHPDNKGIIKRVIALGGTPFPTYKFSNFVKNTNGMLLVESVGCNLKTSEESMKCLRDKPLTDLYSGLDSLPYSLSFTPVVDHDFVISEPHTMLTGTGKDIDKAKECFGSIDLMLGLSNMEGGVHVVLMWSNILNENPNTFTLNQTDFIDIVVPTAMDIIFGEHVPDAIIQNVVFQYADRTDTNTKRRQNVVDISTDIDVAAPILKTAHFHYNISTKSTYMYQFSGNLSLDMQLTPTWLEGANHGTEVYFMFGFSHRMIESWTHTAGFVPTKTERITSAKMMTLLSNFIESGNPNTPDDPGSNVDEWQPYNDVTTSYLDISHDQLSANENFREPHMTFWTKIVPSLVNMIEINNEENDDNATICNCDSHSNDDDDDLWFKLNPRLAENVILTLIIMLGCVLIALIIICLLTVARQNTGEYNMKTKGNK